MFELTLETHFCAAHHLREYEGKCESLHGHNYHVEIILGGTELNELGMLMDFKDVKRMANSIMDRLDHGYLNDIEPFDETNPTTEHIAQYIAESMNDKMPESVHVEKVRCWESEKCAASYIPVSE